jgi:hypothetical protein
MVCVFSGKALCFGFSFSLLFTVFFFFLVDEIIKVQTTTNEHYILHWWILAAARILKGKYKLEWYQKIWLHLLGAIVNLWGRSIVKGGENLKSVWDYWWDLRVMTQQLYRSYCMDSLDVSFRLDCYGEVITVKLKNYKWKRPEDFSGMLSSRFLCSDRS